MASRDDLIKELSIELGASMMDVELDPADYNLAIDRSLQRYRQRSARSVEEAFVVLDLMEGVTEYTLPKEIQEVRVIYRRVAGGIASAGQDIEPFEAGFLNTYLLQSYKMGGLTTFELYSDYRKLIGLMFGAHVIFTWLPQSHKLTIHRNVRAEDSVILHCYMIRPDSSIIDDVYAGPWVRSYALAKCKEFLSQGRGKYTTYNGPGGGAQLNGPTLAAEAATEFARLEDELKTYAEGGTPLGFILG
jgi:hypothetical protein